MKRRNPVGKASAQVFFLLWAEHSPKFWGSQKMLPCTEISQSSLVLLQMKDDWVIDGDLNTMTGVCDLGSIHRWLWWLDLHTGLDLVSNIS